MSRWVVVALIARTSCSPAPRGVSGSEAHPHEAKKVIAAGARSNECQNARSRLSRARAAARIERYRKGFA